MMILPLADALQNCLQNLTSRIAGIDNEQMAGRVMGIGTMLGFSLGAIKEQFNTPNIFTKPESTSHSSGFKGFVDRAKSIVNPNINLTNETNYKGNTNSTKTIMHSQNTHSTSPAPTKENLSNHNATQVPKPKIASSIAKTTYKGTKAYLNVGARMVEGNFSKNSYKPHNHSNKNVFHNTEYINNNAIQKSGDKDEIK